jgi:hypothetical protein
MDFDALLGNNVAQPTTPYPAVSTLSLSCPAKAGHPGFWLQPDANAGSPAFAGDDS